MEMKQSPGAITAGLPGCPGACGHMVTKCREITALVSHVGCSSSGLVSVVRIFKFDAALGWRGTGRQSSRRTDTRTPAFINKTKRINEQIAFQVAGKCVTRFSSRGRAIITDKCDGMQMFKEHINRPEANNKS